MAEILLVSNRGPYSLQETPAGWKRVRAVGGLTSALEPLLKQKGGTWLAWNGGEGNGQEGLSFKEFALPYRWRELSLTAEEVKHYYSGFANSALWPLCHYLVDKCRFEAKDWRVYARVNKKFAAAVQKEVTPESRVWVQDYHLALLPYYLRRRGLGERIALYWHIPFPQDEVFQILPWAKEILQGMLGSDLIGFHTDAYLENFLAAAQKILGAKVDYKGRTLMWQGRKVSVCALPVGVDFRAFQAQAKRKEIQTRAAELREQIGTEFVGVSVDRLDYTKGILEKLFALEIFWELYPQYRGRFSLVQIGVPSREEVPAYQRLRQEVEETVSRINGKYGWLGWTPIYYFSQAFTQEELVVYYLLADVALVTPLRDGLNLVAKEYLATRLEGGALVLSKFAGAAQELEEALLVNPYNRREMAIQIKRALEMPLREQERRRKILQEKIKTHDLNWWREGFLRVLGETKSSDIPKGRSNIYSSLKKPGLSSSAGVRSSF